MQPDPTAEIRAMWPSDLGAADDLRRVVGWNQVPSHWRLLLAHEPGGCFVATAGSRVVGTVTTTSHGTRLAWIGMMVVDPAFRGRGIARRLMSEAIGWLHGKGVATIGLDATPAGKPVYAKLGFVVESSLQRWLRPAGAPLSRACAARSAADRDWAGIDALDRAAMGVDRARLLRALAAEARAVVVWPDVGPVAGWGMLRPGANADHLGPIESTDPAGFGPLLAALAAAAGEHAVFCDIPDAHGSIGSMARSLDFAPQRPLERMRLGPPVDADPAMMAAILDPSIG